MIPYFAIVAGICAAFASTVGKSGGIGKPCTGSVLTFSRVLWCLLGGLLNALMWLAFTKALQQSTTSEALVINMATNFCLSALIGVVFFGESLSLLWGVGATLIVCGIAVMQKGTLTDEKRT